MTGEAKVTESGLSRVLLDVSSRRFVVFCSALRCCSQILPWAARRLGLSCPRPATAPGEVDAGGWLLARAQGGGGRPERGGGCTETTLADDGQRWGARSQGTRGSVADWTRGWARGLGEWGSGSINGGREEISMGATSGEGWVLALGR